MLTNITLENFKAFQKLDNLKVKPITILCGTNSCGKSSILQSILLLKQTLESKKPNQNLLLNGRFVDLGYPEDVIFRKKIENILSFDFTFDTKNNKSPNENVWIIPIGLFVQELIGGESNPFYKSHYIINYRISLKIVNGQKISESENLRRLEIDQICVKVLEKNKFGDKPEIVLSMKNIKDDLFKVEWSNLLVRVKSIPNKEEKISGSTRVRTQFENLIPASYFSLEFSDEHEETAYLTLRNSLNLIHYLVKDFFGLYSYIGPLRHSQKVAPGFYFGDDIVDIGNSGENAPFLFLKDKTKLLIDHWFYDKKNDSFSSKPSVSLEGAFNEWFSLMEIEGFEGVINNRIINLYLNANKYDDTKIDISQVGFGVSQMFPIILEGLRMKKGSTLLLEQPEIHLHPNLQMKMADYFISLALSGKRVMAETHSDHIINRLVRRIVEDENNNLKDLIGIYFIKPSENGAIFEEVIVDENKGIANWPPDFFDQTASEQMLIMQAGLKKRKNQRIKVKD